MCTICTRNIWPLRPRSQHDIEAKLCPVHNFVILSPILNLCYRNDNYIETTLHKQDLGRYLEGQGHNMTLQQKRVRLITLLFKVRFYNYLTEMITILRWVVTTLPIVWILWLLKLYKTLQISSWQRVPVSSFCFLAKPVRLSVKLFVIPEHAIT